MKFILSRVALVFLSANLGASAPAQTADAGSPFHPRTVTFSELKPRSLWQNVGYATVEACFETALWAQATCNLDVLANVLVFDDAARGKAQAIFDALPVEERRKLDRPERMVAGLMSRRSTVASYKVLGVVADANEPNTCVVHWLNRFDDGRVRENKNIKLRLTSDGWRHLVSARFVEQMAKSRVGADGRTSLPVSPPPTTSANAASAPLATGLIAVSALRNRGNATALDALETMFWAKARRDYATLEQVIAVSPEDRPKFAAKWERLSGSSRARMPQITNADRYAISTWLSNPPGAEVGLVIETQTELAADRMYFTGRRQTETGGSNFDFVLTRTGAGWKWFIGQMWVPAASD